MNQMSAVAETPVAKPTRTRSPRRPADQSTRPSTAPTAKSKDAGKTKVSFYLDVKTAEKLAVAAILRRSDQSDVANQILGRALSSITFTDRAASKPECDNEEIGEAGAAA